MVIDEGLPLMEVHISNPSARDEFRKPRAQTRDVSPRCAHTTVNPAIVHKATAAQSPQK